DGAVIRLDLDDRPLDMGAPRLRKMPDLPDRDANRDGPHGGDSHLRAPVHLAVGLNHGVTGATNETSASQHQGGPAALCHRSLRWSTRCVLRGQDSTRTPFGCGAAPLSATPG